MIQQANKLATVEVVKRSQTATGRTISDVWERAADSVSGTTPERKRAFSQLMNGLWAGCGRTVMPDETTLRVWYYCLHDLTEQQLSRGIMRYLTERSREYLTVQLIRELSGIQLPAEEAGIIAWDLAIEAIRIAGGYKVPEFDDPAISQTINNLGGWVWFCDQNPERLRNFVRAQFLKTYGSISKMPRLQPARLKCLIDLTGGKSTAARIGAASVKRID